MSFYTKITGTGREKKREFFLPYITGKDVLDIGCAGEEKNRFLNPDWMHQYVKAAAKSCVGLDHNKEVVEEGKTLGFNLIEGDAQDFHFDQEFDIVCAFDIIEHLQDFKGFFTSVTRVLKADGKLLISIPNPWFFMTSARYFLTGKTGVNADHVCWFCVDTIRELLKRYNLAIERVELGSGEKRLYCYVFLPKSFRHTSIFIVAKKK